MKLFYNKIIIWFIVFILILFLSQVLLLKSFYQIDTNTYFSLIKWDWNILRDLDILNLNLGEKKEIKPWDIVSIVWDESIWVIEWWDKSITRLAWNTQVIIKENYISSDLNNINISFELLRWKSWSNVISIMWKDSYFIQEIKDITASVRWTVFEVDYENDYIQVVEHEVLVSKKDWNTKKLIAWEIFNLKSFFIDELIRIRDDTWHTINKSMDIEYQEKLRQDILDELNINNPFYKILAFLRSLWDKDYKAFYMMKNSDFDKLNTFIQKTDDKTKEIIINKLKTINQTVNFESWDNDELYNYKLKSREVLLNNSIDQDYNSTLIKYSLYDLSQMIDENISSDMIEKTKSFILEHNEYIEFNEDLKESFWESFLLLKNILFPNWVNINLNNIRDTIWNLDKKWEEAVNSFLDKVFNFFK